MHILGIGTLMVIGALLVEFAVPKGASVFIELAQKSSDDPTKWGDLKKVTSLLLGVVLVSAISTGARSNFFNLASRRIARNLRRDVFQSLARQEVGFFDKHKSGELLSRLLEDVTVLQMALS